METELITLKDLAVQLGIDRSGVRKFVLSLGIEPRPVRLSGARGSPLHAITLAEANRVRAERIARGFQVGEPAQRNNSLQSAEERPGFFYIICLDPEARPNRLKFGYAQNVQGRLMEHRCAAPEAKLIESWPAQRSWEPCIIAALSIGARQVSTEVFDVADANETLDKARRFMAMLE